MHEREAEAVFAGVEGSARGGEQGGRAQRGQTGADALGDVHGVMAREGPSALVGDACSFAFGWAPCAGACSAAPALFAGKCECQLLFPREHGDEIQ